MNTEPNNQNHGFLRNIRDRLSGVPFEMLLVIIALMVVAAAVIHFVYEEKVEMVGAYKVWVKHTGNPTSLSYEEWRLLVRVSKDGSGSKAPFIYMPMR